MYKMKERSCNCCKVHEFGPRTVSNSGWRSPVCSVCKVINFRLNSNLTPFYNDLEFKLKCKLVVCLFLISILLTFDYSS